MPPLCNGLRYFHGFSANSFASFCSCCQQGMLIKLKNTENNQLTLLTEELSPRCLENRVPARQLRFQFQSLAHPSCKPPVKSVFTQCQLISLPLLTSRKQLLIPALKSPRRRQKIDIQEVTTRLAARDAELDQQH